MGDSVSSGKRHYGIDALRILSMFMIVSLHILGKGGVLENTVLFSKQYHAAWFLETAAFCAVNCFALCSGFVGIQSKFRYSRIVLLWLQVIFYTLTIALLFSILSPELVTKDSWFNSFFPIMTGQYWYMTAYFGMFFFIPLLNSIVDTVPRRQMKFFMLAVFVLFCTLPNILQADPFQLNGGYSMLWLCILYIIGGYIQKYDIIDLMKRRTAAIGFFAAVFFTWASKIAIERITLHYFAEPEFGSTFLDYTSPTILLAAICLFIFFAKTEYRNKAVTKIISVFAPAALGVYIIHVNPFLFHHHLKGFAASFANDNFIIMTIEVLGSAFIIYSICSVIDILRIKLFQLLKISEFCRNIENRIFSKLK